MYLFLTMSDFNYVQQSVFSLALSTHCRIYVCIYVCTYTHIYIVEYTVLLIEYTTLLISNATCIGI